MNYKKEYFGCRVYLHHYKTTVYPWAFSIRDQNGVLHHYAGIPNRCETEHSALMRAWWRCKWLADGTYNQYYK